MPISITLQQQATPGYPANYPAGPTFGDQTDPCAQLFFQYLGANSQYQASPPANFTNPAAQAIGARMGMTCQVWAGMSDMARRQWIAVSRYGNAIYRDSPQVVQLVGQMNASCPMRPAGQPAMPKPAWTAAAYQGFAALNPSCAAWAQAAAQQYNGYVASMGGTQMVQANAQTGVAPTAPAAPAATSGVSTRTLLIVGGVVAAAGIGYYLYTRQSPAKAQAETTEEA